MDFDTFEGRALFSTVTSSLKLQALVLAQACLRRGSPKCFALVCDTGMGRSSVFCRAKIVTSFGSETAHPLRTAIDGLRFQIMATIRSSLVGTQTGESPEGVLSRIEALVAKSEPELLERVWAHGEFFNPDLSIVRASRRDHPARVSRAFYGSARAVGLTPRVAHCWEQGGPEFSHPSGAKLRLDEGRLVQEFVAEFSRNLKKVNLWLKEALAPSSRPEARVLVEINEIRVDIKSFAELCRAVKDADPFVSLEPLCAEQRSAVSAVGIECDLLSFRAFSIVE